MTQLFVKETGPAGAPALLFIHGWTCTHETMAPLTARFEKGYRCIAVDLLGHGASPKASRYTINEQADAISQTLGDTSEAVAIGHSMGGQIALELAARGSVQASVLLDPAPIVPHEKARQWGEDMRVQLKKVNIPAMMGAFARNQFRRASDPEIVDALVETMQACPGDVVIGAWDGIMDFDGPAALERLVRPTLAIFADKPLNDVRSFAKASKFIETAQTACSGHMQQLEVPDQLEAMIRRFMTLNCRKV
ncbi:MAG: alpha/beta hydrolase [Pseudomonadota bacterium]